jgi:L-ribulose-5-phosphate 4-epimerase
VEAEGVIKFSMEHRAAPLPARRFEALCAELSAWRTILAQLGLIGQDPARYDGAGFGNMSARVGPFPGEPGRRPFVITGTQTGAVRQLRLAHYCLVEGYDLTQSRVQSQGEVAPSSESMTHGAIYDLSPHIRYVFHVHSPTLWGAAEALRLPQTGAEVAYGTVEMARAARELYRATSLSERQIFSMRGHEDGIVAFGRTAQEAGGALIAELARALTG